MRIPAARLGVWVALVALAPGCGEEFCSDPASGGASAPRLESFALHTQQEGDPWTVIFSARFSDSGGDLGGGSAQFYVNGSGTGVAPVAMSDLLRQHGLALDATSGTVAIPLKFGDTVKDGSRVNLGMQLIDAGGRRSNCYGLELDFDVKSAARGVSQWLKGLALWFGIGAQEMA